MTDLSKTRRDAGWFDAGSDVNWQDYGGKWAKRAQDGSYDVVRFENKEEWGDGNHGYHCEVLWVDLPNVSAETLAQALKSCSWVSTDEGIVSDSGELVAAKAETEAYERMLVEALIGYGTYGGLWSESHDTQSVTLRDRAFRYVLESDQQKGPRKGARRAGNRIGSSVADLAKGDTLAGLRNYQEAGFQPQDPTKDLMYKLMGNQL